MDLVERLRIQARVAMDLIERLRLQAGVEMDYQPYASTVAEAANEIERLRAEIARLHDRYWMLEKSERDGGGQGIPSHLR